MHRRDFFAALVGSVAAASTFDLERLLWVPGAKTIFIPKRILLPELAPSELIPLQWNNSKLRQYMLGLDGGFIDVTPMCFNCAVVVSRQY